MNQTLLEALVAHENRNLTADFSAYIMLYIHIYTTLSAKSQIDTL